MFAAAICTHVNRARRFDPNYLRSPTATTTAAAVGGAGGWGGAAGGWGGSSSGSAAAAAELTLTWRDVHDDKLVSLPVVVRLATQQMVGPEGELCVICCVICVMLFVVLCYICFDDVTFG